MKLTKRGEFVLGLLFWLLVLLVAGFVGGLETKELF
jgi:hypothetical protein